MPTLNLKHLEDGETEKERAGIREGDVTFRKTSRRLERTLLKLELVAHRRLALWLRRSHRDIAQGQGREKVTCTL